MFLDGNRSMADRSRDDRGVTSEDNDSDTEVYCDTSDLPLVSVGHLLSLTHTSLSFKGLIKVCCIS